MSNTESLSALNGITGQTAAPRTDCVKTPRPEIAQPRNIKIYAHENRVVRTTELKILNEATLRAIVKCLMEFSHSLTSFGTFAGYGYRRSQRVGVSR